MPHPGLPDDDVPPAHVVRVPPFLRYRSVEVPRRVDRSLLRGADLVHATTPWPFLPDLVASAARKAGLPTVVTVRDRLASTQRALDVASALYARTWGRRLLQRARRVTVTTRFMAEELRDSAGVDSVVIPNGVHLPPLEESSPREDLLYVGRLQPNKGVLDLPEVLATVVARVGDTSLDVVGEGPLRDELASRFRSLGLEESVRFLGPLPHEATLTLMRRRKLVLMPSYAEPFGRVAVEAMGMGARVVGYDAGGLPEVTADAPLARLVPRGDAVALAEAAVEALKSEGGEVAAARDVRRRYAWDAVAHRFERVLTEVAGA